MNFDVIIRRGFSLRVATCALLCAGGLTVAPPVRAQSAFNSLLGYFGMQSNKDDDTIDYHARAPIVVPPRLDLPKPKEAARDPSWPKDPDIAAARRAGVDSHTPAAQTTSAARAETGALPTEGPPDECQTSDNALCLSTPLKVLKSVTNGFTSSDTVQPGPEPSRKLLTEPPPGYRIPAAVAKAAAAAPKDKPEPANSAAPIGSKPPKTSIGN